MRYNSQASEHTDDGGWRISGASCGESQPGLPQASYLDRGEFILIIFACQVDIGALMIAHCESANESNVKQLKQSLTDA